MQLPDHNTHLADKNFITHMLYKNAYYRHTSQLLYNDVHMYANFLLTYLRRSLRF